MVVWGGLRLRTERLTATFFNRNEVAPFTGRVD